MGTHLGTTKKQAHMRLPHVRTTQTHPQQPENLKTKGPKMTDQTAATETSTEQPTLTLAVAGILPIEHDTSDNKVGLLLMADGTVRWTQLQEAEEE